MASVSSTAVTLPSPFKTPQGEALYIAAYNAAVKLWPAAYVDLYVQSRFGRTHLVVSGPMDAPPLLLLHGYFASLTVWSANVADFSKDYRVYAVDVMGQPSKSIPSQPIRNRVDFVEWLGVILDSLCIKRVDLVGVSYGAWIALNYALSAPERLNKLVLLSLAGGLLPVTTQFILRGMAIMLPPRHFWVKKLLRWMICKENLENKTVRTIYTCMLEQMSLGAAHFHLQLQTVTVQASVFSDDELRSMRVPTLLLYGQQEVVCDAAKALQRAEKLLPNFEGELVPHASHAMVIEKHDIVDQRILEFLKKN